MATRSIIILFALLSCVPAFVALTPKTSTIAAPAFSSALSARPAVAPTSPKLRMTAAELEAAAPPPTGGGTSVSASVVNLFKNIVGSGVLALAAGVAAFSGSPLALVPSLLILLAVGAVSAYTYSSIARVGAAVGASSYRETWMKVYGEKTTVLTDLTVIFMTACAGLSYAIILGDSFAGISQLAGASGMLAKSNFWILLLSAVILLPLALLRDLSSLAVGSLIGTAGTLYTALFCFLRLFDGTYKAGGKYFGALAESAKPAFSAPTAASPLINPSMFVLISMLASAFLAHYNAPKFYSELEAPADGSSKLPRFNLVVALGFLGAAVVMGSVMAGGFLTFGSASQGLILNSYATGDPLAFLARLGIGMSIIFSYPLNFVGLRDGILSALGKTEEGKKNSVHIALSLLLMLIMNGTALFLKDLGLVVGLGGAILGSALVYIFPALMATGEKEGAMGAGEKKLNWALAGLGVFFAGLGSVMCLK